MRWKKLTRHDRSVTSRAHGLKSYGWKVWADVPGFRKPQTISVGRQRAKPDIIAKKGQKIRIIEVETSGSFGSDADQRNVLRKYAKRKRGVQFMWRKV